MYFHPIVGSPREFSSLNLLLHMRAVLPHVMWSKICLRELKGLVSYSDLARRNTRQLCSWTLGGSLQDLDGLSRPSGISQLQCDTPPILCETCPCSGHNLSRARFCPSRRLS